MGTLADLIEQHIKRELQHSGNQIVVLNRAQLADAFSCVPSQINYVLSTRFSRERGYIIESRRGGGGYIRIVRINRERGTTLDDIIEGIGPTVTARDVDNILSVVLDLQLLPRSTLQVIRGLIQQETSTVPKGRDVLRASLLRSLLLLALQLGE